MKHIEMPNPEGKPTTTIYAAVRRKSGYAFFEVFVCKDDVFRNDQGYADCLFFSVECPKGTTIGEAQIAVVGYVPNLPKKKKKPK